jgi:hypothetical protein
MADSNPLDGRHVANSPVGIGDVILTPGIQRERSLAVDVMPVYQDGATKGWVYKSDRGEHFYQENAGTKSTWSASVGNFGASMPNPPAQKLEPGPVVPQLPSGSELRPGPSVERDRSLQAHLHPGMTPGKNFGGSPYALGDEIPTKNGTFTRVTDINVVKDKDSGLAVGYLYKGENGQFYGQRVDPTPISFSVGGAGITPAGQKEVLESHPPGTLHYGPLEPVPRNERIPMYGDKPMGYPTWQDALRHTNLHAALPDQLQELKSGQSATGTVLGMESNGMIVSGGRVAYSIPLDRLPAGTEPPKVGDQVAVSLARDGGPATVNVATPGQEAGIGRA